MILKKNDNIKNERNTQYACKRNTKLTQNILKKIIKIKDYFIGEIQEREAISKRLSKYVAAFNYLDKSLIILSATGRGISFATLAIIIGMPV